MPWALDLGLRVSVVRDGTGSAMVRLAGEIDIVSVEAVRRAVGELEAGTRRIAVDLSRVTFCDMAGVRFLIAARKQASKAGTDLVVLHPRGPVYRVLDVTGAMPLVCPAAASVRVPAPDDAVVAACEEALAEAIGVGGADTGNAQLMDPATGALRIVAQHGFKRQFLDFFEIVHDEESACGTALAAGKPVWVPEVARSPIFTGTPALDAMLDAGSRAVASVPVRADDGKVIAMISVHYHQPTAWTERQRRQLAAVAAVTGRLLSTLRQAPGATEL
jgi:anti-anti-sigma factor